MAKCISLTQEQKDKIREIIKINVVSRIQSELNRKQSSDTETQKATYSDIGKRVTQEIYIDIKKDTYKMETAQEASIFKDTLDQALNSEKVTSLFEGLPEYALEHVKLGAKAGISEIITDYVEKGIVPTRDKLRLYNDPTIELNERVRAKMKGFNEAYSKSDLIHKYFLDKFKEQVMVNTIVDFERGIIVKTDEQLNRNISAIKDSLYQDLVEFTLKNQAKEKLLPMNYRRSLYKDGKFKNERLSLILNDSSKYINKIQINQLESQFLSNRFSSNLSKNLILNAHLAFTLLSGDNFDNVLSAVLGDAYIINTNYGRHSDATAYKYSLNGKSNITTSWRVDDYADAISELGNVPSLLIETTPIHNFRVQGVSKEFSAERLDLNQFINTFNKLRDPVIRRKAGLETMDVDLRGNPTEYIRKVLSKVMKWDNAQFGFNMTDMNILKSVYTRFYDSSNPNSLYSIIIKDQAINNQSTTYNLLNAISGVIDRTQASHYLQYVINHDGTIDNTRLRTASLNTRKRYYENRIQEHTKSLGGVGNKQAILDKYNIKPIFKNPVEANMQWTVEYATTENPSNIMEMRYQRAKGESYGLEVKVGNEWKKFNTEVPKISTSKIANAVLNGDVNSLIDSDGRYLGFIKFMSEITGLNFLSQSYIREFAIMDGQTPHHFIEHLARLTNSILHKLDVYNEYDMYAKKHPNSEEATSIKKFALSKLRYYSSRKNNDEVNIDLMFEPQDNSLKVTDKNDYMTIDHLAMAHEIANNNTYKSTLKNAEGNMISSNRISHYNGLFERVVRTKAQAENASQSSNLFATNKDLFLGTIVKSDMKGAGISKQVSNFTTSELIYTSMIQDFYASMYRGNTEAKATAINHYESSKPYALIQPIVFSDKKYYVNLILDTESNIIINDPFTGNDISFSLKDATKDNLLSAIAATVGEGYHKLANNIKIDYNRIFSHNNSELLNKALQNSSNRVLELSNVLKDSSIQLGGEVEYLGETYNKLIIPESLKNIAFEAVKKDLAKMVNGEILLHPQFENSVVKVKDHIEQIFNDVVNTNNRLIELTSKYKAETEAWNKEAEIVNREMLKLEEWFDNFNKQDDQYKALNDLEYSTNYNKYYELADSLSERPTNILETLNLSDYDLLMRNTSKSDFINSADQSGVDLVTDLHFVTKNGELRASNSLIYNTEKLYDGTKTELNKYFKNEEFKFVRDLFDNNIKLNLRDSDHKLNKTLRLAVDRVLGDNKVDWIDTDVDRLILAKNSKTGEKIVDSIQLAEHNPNDIIVNPLIQKYFYSSYLVSKNYRTLMVGTELSYPTHNSDFKPTLENIEIELSEQDTAQSKRSSSNIAPIHNVTMNDRNGPASVMKIAVIDDILAEAWNFSGDKNSRLESSDGSAIVAGPLHWLENYALQDKKTGKDKKMHAFDINSKYHSGQFLKFATFLMSNDRMAESMGSEAPMYNLWKKMSDFKWSEATRENRFGRVNSDGEFKPFEVDLTKDIFGGNLNIYEVFNDIGMYKSTMNRMIVEPKAEVKGDMVNADVYIFDDGGQLIRSWNDTFDKNTIAMYNGYYHKLKILDLVKADRVELPFITSEENRIAEQQKISQALDLYTKRHGEVDQSKLYLLRVDAVHEDGTRIGDGTGFYEVHEIDSLFDLHKALGGVNSFQIVDGELVRSDASLEALSFFMNNVGEYHGELKTQINAEGKTEILQEAAEIIDQTNTYQPLKTGDALISYIVNKSAIKTGSINVNNSEAYSDPNIPLKTMDYGIDALGIQSDTETTIDRNSNITEFSQVIQALIAKGYMTEDVEDIYTALANIARSEVSTLVEAAQKLNDDSAKVRNKAKTELAKLTIRNLIDSLGEGDTAFGTQKATLELLKKGLREMAKGNKEFVDLDFLMPLSDPSLYKKATIDFTSFVNKIAIKRKFTGKGLTLTPTYNMIQLYNMPNQNAMIRDNGVHNPEIQYKFSEIQKKARATTADNVLRRLKRFKFNERFAEFYNYMQNVVDNHGADSQVLRSRGLTVDEFMKYNQLQVIFATENDMRMAGRGNIDLLSPESRILIPSDDVAELVNSGRLEADWVAKNTTQGQNILSGYHEIYINTFDKYIKVKDTFSRFIPDVTKPINLRPSRINWRDTKGYSWNAFDLKSVRDSFKFKSLLSETIKDLDNINDNSEIQEKDALAIQRLNQFVRSLEGLDYQSDVAEIIKDYKGVRDTASLINKLQVLNITKSEKAFHDLAKGKFKMNQFLAQERGIELDNEGYAKIKADSFNNEAAEIILPNIFKYQFDIGRNVSISQVLEQKDLFFINKFLEDTTISDNVAYDLAFVTPSKLNNLYIVFDQDRIDSSYHMVEHDVTKTEVYEGYEYLLNNRNRRTIKLNKVNSKGETTERVVSMYKSNTGDITYLAHSQEGLQSIVDNMGKYDSFKLNNERAHIVAENLDGIKTKNKFIDILKNRVFNEELDITTLPENLTMDEIQFAINNHYVEKANDIIKNEIASKFGMQKYVSFNEALNFISSRIPAQTMQSFMKMRAVAFTNESEGAAHVSHWQTWLQGSDYDIDTAWLMGVEIGKNGLYQGWSPYFSLDSVAHLEISKQLKSPTGIELKLTQGNPTATDITDQIAKYAMVKTAITNKGESFIDSVDFIHTLVEILNKTKDSTSLTYDSEIIQQELAQEVTDIINTHNLYTINENKYNMHGKLSADDKGLAFRNIANSKMMKVIQDPRNTVQSHMPIEMDAPKRAASKSALGQKSMRDNFNNPATLSELQSQNGDGKDGISISAVGLKVFFTLSYYYNKVLKSGDPAKIKNLAIFKSYPALANSMGDSGVRLALANINWAEVSKSDNIDFWKSIIERKASAKGMSNEEITLAVQQQLKVGQDQALIMSAMLSAATDNAKELILSKLSAGPETMGVYLYLSMLGYEFDKIAGFMTSDTVQSVIKLSKNNSFESGFKNNSINVTMSLLENGPSISDFFTEFQITNTLGNYLSDTDVAMKTGSIIHTLKNVFQDPQGDIRALFKNLKLDDRMKISLNRYIQEFETLRRYKNSFDPDVFDTLREITKDSSSIVVLGQMLGMNQGIKTSVAERLATVNSFENHFTKVSLNDINKASTANGIFEILKEKANVISPIKSDVTGEIYLSKLSERIFKHKLHEEFDFFKFTDPNNSDYARTAIDLYDIYKPTFNIFDVLFNADHFKEMYVINWAMHQKSYNESFKYRMTYDIIKELTKEESNNKYSRKFSDKQIGQIENYVDDLMIYEWLKKQSKSFTIERGELLLDRNFKEHASVDKLEFDLSNRDGEAEFIEFIKENGIPRRWAESRMGSELNIDNQQGLQEFINKVEVGNMPSELLVNDQFTFIISKDANQRYITENFTEKAVEQDMRFTLDNLNGMQNFKKWVEDYVVPELKQGIVDSEHISTTIKSNTFIRDIDTHKGLSGDSGGPMTFLRLPIDMTSFRTNHDTSLFQSYQKDYANLSKYTKGGMRLDNLFFLYNLLVNKNKYGADRYTSLFSNYEYDTESIAYKYHKSLGEIDAYKQTPNLADHLDRIYIKIAEKPRNSFDFDRPAYLRYDPNLGRNIVESKNLDTSLLNGSGMNDSQLAIKFNHGIMPLVSEVHSPTDITLLSGVNDISTSLNHLIKMNKITIKYDC